MQEDRDYKITSVEARQAYTTDYGTMQPYALKLEGVEGFVQLSQKPETQAPLVGQTIHGHTYEQQGQHGGFLKFKKVNPAYAGGDSGSKPQVASADTGRMLALLEAIAIAVDAVVEPDKSQEQSDEEEIDLSEIPF